MPFADDIALYALGYWSHEHHPMRLDHLCLNTIQRKSPCRSCTDACPAGVSVHAAQISWAGCTNCNLCVTACPTQAINQSSTSFQDVRRRILETEEAVSFGCPQAPESPDVPLACLAALPWDLAAAASLSGGLVLMAQPCSECPEAELVLRVKALVSSLKRFLGKERFGELVSMHRRTEAASGANKRLAFQSLADTARGGAERLAGEPEKPTMSCYRALLLEVLEAHEQAGDAQQVTWEALEEHGSCRACNVCALMCPHNAIDVRVPEHPYDKSQLTDEELEAAGIDPGSQMLVHQASKCTQCGLCYLSCMEEAIDGWDQLASSTVPACKGMPIEVAICEKCKRPFKPEGDETFCTACSRFKKVL